MIWNGLFIILLPKTIYYQTAGNRIKTAKINYEENIDYNGRTHRNGVWRNGV